ncbi:MAG: hypothetical protein ACJ77M_10390 [Thermoleophilaceae bacterium]
MGRRARRREKGGPEPVATTAYTDPGGNVLTLRDSLSDKTLAKLRELEGPAAASQEDLWQRRTEILFERLAVSWEIAGLPMTKQAELIGRYRMASPAEREWVRRTIDEHVRRVRASS